MTLESNPVIQHHYVAACVQSVTLNEQTAQWVALHREGFAVWTQEQQQGFQELIFAPKLLTFPYTLPPLPQSLQAYI